MNLVTDILSSYPVSLPPQFFQSRLIFFKQPMKDSVSLHHENDSSLFDLLDLKVDSFDAFL